MRCRRYVLVFTRTNAAAISIVCVSLSLESDASTQAASPFHHPTTVRSCCYYMRAERERDVGQLSRSRWTRNKSAWLVFSLILFDTSNLLLPSIFGCDSAGCDWRLSSSKVGSIFFYCHLHQYSIGSKRRASSLAGHRTPVARFIWIWIYRACRRCRTRSPQMTNVYSYSFPALCCTAVAVERNWWLRSLYSIAHYTHQTRQKKSPVVNDWTWLLCRLFGLLVIIDFDVSSHGRETRPSSLVTRRRPYSIISSLNSVAGNPASNCAGSLGPALTSIVLYTRASKGSTPYYLDGRLLCIKREMDLGQKDWRHERRQKRGILPVLIAVLQVVDSSV